MPFWHLTYRTDPSMGFHAWWLKRRGLTQGCAFSRGFFHIATHLGGQKQFLGVNRRIFKPNSRNPKNVHIIKTTASIPTKFYTVIKTEQRPSWVVPTQALHIQDGGRPPSWKNRKMPYIGRGSSDFDKIWHSDAVCIFWPFWSLKFKFLKIQDDGSRHLEKSKSRYLGNGFTDRHNIWHDDAYWPSKSDTSWNFELFKIQDGGRPPSWKIEKCSINGHYN